jgi:hypothetical protein
MYRSVPLCTYRFLLISNKFCDLSFSALATALQCDKENLLHCSAVRKIYCTDFFGPQMHSPDGLMPFHRVQKSLDFQGPAPPTCPRNGYPVIPNLPKFLNFIYP